MLSEVETTSIKSIITANTMKHIQNKINIKQKANKTQNKTAFKMK